jgi:putative peptidoglycan lipid II flippase
LYGEVVVLTLRRSFLLTGGLSGFSFLASFASLIVISYHFGASAEVDAYWVAFALMNLLAFPLAPLREALVPEFHRRLQQAPEEASAYFSRTMTLILLVAGAGVLVGWLLAEPLTALAVSGKQAQVRSLAVTQLYWLAPAVLLLAVSETLNSILAAYHLVILQSVARLLGAASTLAVLALLAGVLQSHVLPLGFITAQVVTTLVQIIALRRRGLVFHLVWPGALGGRFMAVSGALLVTYAASQAYAVYEKHTLTAFTAGLVSSFQYAVSLTNVLITLIGVALSNVLWPRFMEHVASDDKNRLYAEISMASRFTFLITGWLCAMAWLNATALIELIYARGAFDAAAVVRTADALRLAVFAAVPVSVGLIMGRALISLGAARSVATAGLTTAFVGSTTLAVAHFLGSSTLALSHWLLANLVGLAIQATLLARICGGLHAVFFTAVWWLVRWIGVLALAGIATQMIPVAQPGLVALVGDIFVRSVAFSVMFAALAWGVGLMFGLPAFFRR